MSASSTENPKPLNKATLRGPIHDFQAFCETEVERRRNSGEDFDQSLFDEAMELVIKRLQLMEERGQA